LPDRSLKENKTGITGVKSPFISYGEECQGNAFGHSDTAHRMHACFQPGFGSKYIANEQDTSVFLLQQGPSG
jgi:hypothetical protein